MLIRLIVQTLRRREVPKHIQYDMVNESEAALSVNNVDLLRSEFDVGFSVFIKHGTCINRDFMQLSTYS